jgi:tetratricopeptide (TPR) repeat protein
MKHELLNYGKQSFAEGNYQTALSYFSNTLEKDENDDFALLYRGCTYNKLGIYDKAIEDFNNLEKLNKTEEFLVSRAIAHFYSENYKEAKLDLERAREKVTSEEDLEIISNLLLKLD